ncbi:MAG: flagellar basal-body rod protein FlgF [Desulfobacteraceae bacterium]|nr:MAG: flagellar basal-body rod protein FlgF [Desulfobacteraceae bacterium]
MSGTIYQAAAGALLQQMRLDMLTNNLANINTTGYKADVPVFQILDDQSAPAAEAPAIPGGLSPYAASMYARTNFAPGPLARTGNPLDVAVAGRGFFEIQAPEGSRFSRKGNFTVNEQGVLATTEGWPVMGQGGEISIDGSRIEINDNGDVYVDGEAVDTLRIVDFAEPGQLRKTGQTYFVPEEGTEGEILEEGAAQIVQGFLESSNVDAIRTMTELIETLRVFESYQRIIRTADEATSKTVNEVGRSA